MSTDQTPAAPEWKRWIPAPAVLAAWCLLALVLTWTYWGTLAYLLNTWSSTPDYEHGYFVPIFAAFLLWQRQEMVNPWPRKGSWWGVVFFVAWILARYGNLYYNYDRDADSLIMFCAGLTLFVGGWQALRWAWPSIVFLVFMIPLPAFLAEGLSAPLQRIATIGSVYTLQTMGIAAITTGTQGNVIHLPVSGRPLEVAQACCGLRMLMLFFAICSGAAFVLRVSLWEKAVLVISAIPIALISNIFRITLDGVLTEWINPAVGEWMHHNAGWIMMLVALAMLWAEMSLVSKLVVETAEEGPLTLTGPGATLAVRPRDPGRKTPGRPRPPGR